MQRCQGATTTETSPTMSQPEPGPQPIPTSERPGEGWDRGSGPLQMRWFGDERAAPYEGRLVPWINLSTW
jgi:hypothetical protein